MAVLNENFKAIEYLCRFSDINLYERNALGQTPRDIALILPRRRTALKIIDHINKRINSTKNLDTLKLTPGARHQPSPLLRKSTFKSSRLNVNKDSSMQPPSA